MSQNLIGIGLRAQHLKSFLEAKPDIGWVEVHIENYFSCGGPDFDLLLKIREDYPVSLHGIGMSLGSASGINIDHLNQAKKLIDIIDPFLVSDHLSWSVASENFLPDLIPTPFNNETLEIFSSNISKTQNILGRKLLLENPSTYFSYTNSIYSESEFINLIAKKTGISLLLDLNNIYISGLNNDWCPRKYIDDIDPNIVEEFHLSGHSVSKISEDEFLYIDSHDDYVCHEVWELFQYALSKIGKKHSLLEWDSKLPDLDILIDEAKKAQKYFDYCDNSGKKLCTA